MWSLNTSIEPSRFAGARHQHIEGQGHARTHRVVRVGATRQDLEARVEFTLRTALKSKSMEDKGTARQ